VLHIFFTWCPLRSTRLNTAPNPSLSLLLLCCRRRLELFGEDHNIREGWVTVGRSITQSTFKPQVRYYRRLPQMLMIGCGVLQVVGCVMPEVTASY
jgi:hypothetical protein